MPKRQSCGLWSLNEPPSASTLYPLPSVAARLLFITCCLVDPESGGTALHVAVLANDEKQVTQLLELGAQSSVGDCAGVTPVMSAAEHGHIEVLQTLALKGINAGGGSMAVGAPGELGGRGYDVA